MNVEVTPEEGYKIRKTVLEDNREMILLIEEDSYIATFWNEDRTEIIGQVPFKATDKKINEPEIPAKDGHIGFWRHYEIKAEDIETEVYYVRERIDGTTYQLTDENGITWNYTYMGGKATEVYYERGTLGERVEIPAYLDGYEVKSINNPGDSNRNIFAKANYATINTMQEVILPNTLESIGNYAFIMCRSLTEINIPNSVESIGEWAFRGCTSLTEIDIPESVTSIRSYAFASCISLTEIEIPNSVTYIGESAFNAWSNNQTLNIHAISPPSGWNKRWNYDCQAKIVWGYNSE